MGAAFPPDGAEGKKRIQEYASVHDLAYDEKELSTSVIEESFQQSGKLVVEGLREILFELFDESKDSDIKEIELAKLYHEQMEILKIFDRTSEEEYAEGEKLLDEEIDEEIGEFGIAGCRKRLAEYKGALPVAPRTMTAEEREAYYRRIDSYRDYAGDECLIHFILHG